MKQINIRRCKKIFHVEERKTQMKYKHLLNKYETYAAYYPLCDEGRVALHKAATEICADEKLAAEALAFKARLANITDWSGAEDLAKEITDKSVQFAAFTYTLAIEDMERLYEEKAMPRDVLTETIADLSVWINRHYNWFGEWGFSDCGWLNLHLNGKLFKLGRLQFEIGHTLGALPEECKLDLKEGDPYLNVHVPRGGSIDEAGCLESFERAKAFFPQYFNIDFKAFGCHTWLFNPDFEEMLPYDSNILKFQRLFNICKTYENYDVLHYVFVNITKENIKDAPTDTRLRRAIIEHVLGGGTIQSGTGYRMF